MRAGLVAASVLNVHRTKKSDKLWRWTDFFADPDEPEKPLIESANSISMKLGVWAEAANSKNRKT